MAITGINNSSYTSYYASNYKNTVKKTDSEKDSTNTKDGNVTTSTVELKTSRPGVTKTEQIRQCQMTYEKTEQKKKAQMNLENCRSFRLWQPTATLDGTKKNCCRLITDGEELKNSQSFSVDYSSVAVLFRAIKGTPLCGGWDNYLWL